MVGNFPYILNINKLFLKLNNRFIRNPFSPFIACKLAYVEYKGFDARDVVNLDVRTMMKLRKER